MSHTRFRILPTATACAGLSIFGCASNDGTLDDPLAQVSPSAPMSDAAVPVPYLASVSANGTGCPKDSWDTAITRDGRRFTSTFSTYEAFVDDGQRLSFKDCNLTIKLHSDAPLSYAVDAYYHDGYAFLEAGVTGFITANYYFQGNPVPAVSAAKRTDLTGPIDRTFIYDERVADENLVWSPCGRDRNLQIVSRVGLQKQQNQGAGYINLSAVETVQGGGHIRHGLRWRPCVEDVRDAGDAGRSAAVDAGGLDAGTP